MSAATEVTHELAVFLRTRRERLTPEDVNIPARRRRRTPGLRREEVAELAGVSIDYIVRLEQGRGMHPSVEVCEALACALRLDDDERGYLFDLAGQRAVMSGGPSVGADTAPPESTTARLVRELSPLPAMLIDSRFDIIAWNPEMAGLLIDFAALPPRRRNSIEVCLFEPRLQAFYVDRAEIRREGIADLRAAWASSPDDVVLRRMIGDWCARSDEFARMWAMREVRVNGRGRKRFLHPVVGPLTVDFDVLTPLANSLERLVIHRAADAASQTALDRISAAIAAAAVNS